VSADTNGAVTSAGFLLSPRTQCGKPAEPQGRGIFSIYGARQVDYTTLLRTARDLKRRWEGDHIVVEQAGGRLARPLQARNDPNGRHDDQVDSVAHFFEWTLLRFGTHHSQCYRWCEPFAEGPHTAIMLSLRCQPPMREFSARGIEC